MIEANTANDLEFDNNNNNNNTGFTQNNNTNNTTTTTTTNTYNTRNNTQKQCKISRNKVKKNFTKMLIWSGSFSVVLEMIYIAISLLSLARSSSGGVQYEMPPPSSTHAVTDEVSNSAKLVLLIGPSLEFFIYYASNKQLRKVFINYMNC